MASDRTGKPHPTRDIRVARLGLAKEIGSRSVKRWAREVLDGERVGPAALSISFMSDRAMRALNRRELGHDHSTDVIAFRLEHIGQLVGDIYICPAVARRSARESGAPVRDELLRLVVHGVLHVVGLRHPIGPSRTASPMWRRQERYVSRLRSGARA